MVVLLTALARRPDDWRGLRSGRLTLRVGTSGDSPISNLSSSLPSVFSEGCESGSESVGGSLLGSGSELSP